MAKHLRNNISKFLDTFSDDRSEIQTLPEFLAQLAIAKWPRGRDKAIENLNPILFIVISTVMGWTQYVIECAETVCIFFISKIFFFLRKKKILI